MQRAEIIDAFVDEVEMMAPSNYGDFKRKLDLQVLRLAEKLAPSTPDMGRRVYDFKEQVIFKPLNDCEAARQIALELAESLRN